MTLKVLLFLFVKAAWLMMKKAAQNFLKIKWMIWGCTLTQWRIENMMLSKKEEDIMLEEGRMRDYERKK